MRGASVRRFAVGLSFAGACALGATTARANGYETPSGGTEVLGRGSAWLARAADPLATFYNPAALSRNGNGVSLTVNLFSQKTCFTRKGAGGSAVNVGGSYDYGKVCNDAELFPNPQVAFQYRISDKLGIGIAVMGPSAVGKAKYPDLATATRNSASQFSGAKVGDPATMPSGSRYLLTELDAKIIWPQIGIGYELAPKLRVGASFIWGLAFLKLGNVSMGLNNQQVKDPNTGRVNELSQQDLIANVEAKDLFVPGFVASALYTVGDNIDIGAWFHWSDAVKAKGQAEINGFAYEANSISGGAATADPKITTNKTPDGQASIKAPQPMEARVGIRYYKPREGVVLEQKGGLLKDPLRDEVFDVELDAEWSHDSQFDNLEIRFNGPPTPIYTSVGQNTAGQSPLANVPVNADVPHKWKDSYGVRLGGDYVVLPGQLALRAGGWFQTSSMRKEYLHVDFVPMQRIGLALGGTYRLGPVDIQAGYSHVFFTPLDNGGDGAIKALTGDANAKPVANRSDYAINGGKLTSSINVFSIGGVLRWD